MQEQQSQEYSSSRPTTRLLDDVLVEVVDFDDDDEDFAVPGALTRRDDSDTTSAIRLQRSRQAFVAPQYLVRLSQGHSEHLAFEIADLKSPAVERLSLRAAFVQLYYPRTKTPATSTFRAVIQQDSEVRYNQALCHAMDAICLVEVGNATHNQAYIRGGTVQYQCALGIFRRQLQHAIGAKQFDSSLLAACHALMFCQRFSTLGGGDEESYLHMKGLGQMMAVRGLDSFTSEFDKLLLEDYQHYALRLGMIKRRPVNRDLETAWSKRARSSAGPRFFPQMCDLAFHLPGLLEECDQACAEIREENIKGRANACTRAMELMAELGGLERTLQSWLQDWYSSMEQLPYRPVPAVSLPFLKRHLSDGLLDTFASALTFPSFASAVAHSRFWACLLLIRSTSAQLCTAVIPDGRRSTMQFHNVTECADDLCLSMAYLCGAKGHGLAGPAGVTGHLKIAFEWYKQIQDRDKMDWCRAIAKLVKARGLSSPDLAT